MSIECATHEGPRTESARRSRHCSPVPADRSTARSTHALARAPCVVTLRDAYTQRRYHGGRRQAWASPCEKLRDTCCVRINRSGQNSTNLPVVKRPEKEILRPSCETKGEPIRWREPTRVPIAPATSPWPCSRQGEMKGGCLPSPLKCFCLEDAHDDRTRAARRPVSYSVAALSRRAGSASGGRLSWVRGRATARYGSSNGSPPLKALAQALAPHRHRRDRRGQGASLHGRGHGLGQGRSGVRWRRQRGATR
jgi:hypothetical protein